MIRRVHLYTGLLLLPWVLFFGISGMMSNHPSLGSLETVRTFDQAIASQYGFAALDANQMADEILAALNADANSGAVYKRVSSSDASFDGAITFLQEENNGKAVVSLNPSDGTVAVHRIVDSPKSPAPDFLKTPLPSFPGASKDDFRDTAGAFLTASGEFTPNDSLNPSPKGAPELRFRIESADTGQKWNVAMNLLGGSLSARESGKDTLSLHSAMTRMHKIHNYPAQMGARWVWTLFADITGLTMAFWGLSGAIMWWQMKPTRLIGTFAVCLAVCVSAFVFSGTYSNLNWTSPGARPAARGDASPKGGKTDPSLKPDRTEVKSTQDSPPVAVSATR